MKRKSTWLSSAALLAAAWLCGSAGAGAQTVSQVPVSSPDELHTGYYVIKGTATVSNRAVTGFIYYRFTSDLMSRYYVDSDITGYDETTIPDYDHVWLLTNNNDEDGTFTLQNVGSGYFIAENFVTGENKANLKIEEKDGSWYMANYQHSGASTYCCATRGGSGYALSWSSSIYNGTLQLEFYSVTEDEALNSTLYPATSRIT